MRRSTLFLLFLLITGIALAASLFDASLGRDQASAELQQRAALVRELGLTDLALFTEARYTRNPSQADLHSAFQDHPMALEHFPSGSIQQPPRWLTE
jgi:hypothetical protein